MQPPPTATIQAAAQRVRGNDIPGAYAILETALAADPDATQLREFLAYVAATTGDHQRAAEAYRFLFEADPGNMTMRVNLATALMASGRLEEADAVCAGQSDPRLVRLMAYLSQQRGEAGTIEAYERVVAAYPGDFESWNNLGNALLADGRPEDAVQALDRAVQLRPDQLPIYFNYAHALALVDRHQGRQHLMRQAATRWPEDAAVQLELGLAELAANDVIAAEAALRKAIALDTGVTRQALVELGMLLENLSRIDDLAALIEEVGKTSPDIPELTFLNAWLLRRKGEWDAALALAEETPDTIHPLRRSQLIADLNDRLGNTERAFSAFAAMNREALAIQRPLSGPSYREHLDATLATLAPEHVAKWRSLRSDHSQTAPIFIVGFPRSGTTLLDTLLLNVPNVHVLEELPAFAQATEELGYDQSGLAALDDVQASSIRAKYLSRIDELSPCAAGSIIVDKHPLHMTRIATIGRLFPNARVVLVERHPFDAVLSCFMANFQLNLAMRSFTTLEETALVYDRAFSIWQQASSLFPDLRIERVRYERLVTDMEGELRPLLAALDLPWSASVMDNQHSAATRDRVRTASYSQISEPIYQRAVARWERYRSHLAPVLPILTPWAERMGYPV
jgi:tetratricopeptide (TPR) repeat protein